MLIMMMECRKFSPDTPTCPAEGGADPSLTTFTPITVQSNTGRGAQPEEGDKSEFKGGGGLESYGLILRLTIATYQRSD